VRAFLRQHLNRPNVKDLRVALGFADLNGDGRLDALAYVSGAALGGSGGCRLYVLENDGRAYRIVAQTSVTRPPIRVLLRRSHGWNDIGVRVSGGGIGAGHEVALRFDGMRYPPNPTTEAPLKGPSAGKTAIADETSTPL